MTMCCSCAIWPPTCQPARRTAAASCSTSTTVSSSCWSCKGGWQQPRVRQARQQLLQQWPRQPWSPLTACGCSWQRHRAQSVLCRQLLQVWPFGGSRFGSKGQRLVKQRHVLSVCTTAIAALGCLRTLGLQKFHNNGMLLSVCPCHRPRGSHK